MQHVGWGFSTAEANKALDPGQTTYLPPYCCEQAINQQKEIEHIHAMLSEIRLNSCGVHCQI